MNPSPELCPAGRRDSGSVLGERSHRWLGRAALLLCAVSLGSCRFLADEFTRLDRAGPIMEQQDLPPSPLSDRG